MIGCVRVPYFAAAVERRDDPSLADQPLVIVRGSAGSDKVFAVSGEAAELGVKPGVYPRQARALCPEAHFLSTDLTRYQRAFDDLLEVLKGFSPRVESGGFQPAAVGYLDLGQPEQAQARQVARRIGQTVLKEAGLAPSMGLAGGKFPAYVATASVEPNQVLLLPPGREADFLAPFPVDLLALDEETARRLRLLGIHTLGQLAALPAAALVDQFGWAGRRLHQLARGHDERPLLPHCSEAMEAVARQLDGPVSDWIVLGSVLQAMALELADRLQARGQVARELWLVLHLEDGTTREERIVMRRPSGDPGRLAGVLNELLMRLEVRQAVIELEACLTGLVPARGQQLDLFVHEGGQEGRLREALKDLLGRYGPGCFYHVSLPERGAHLPERRFRLQEMETP
jgi:DNA polymerase-4